MPFEHDHAEDQDSTDELPPQTDADTGDDDDQTIISSRTQLSAIEQTQQNPSPDAADAQTVAATPDNTETDMTVVSSDPQLKPSDKATNASPPPEKTTPNQDSSTTTSQMGRGALLQKRYQIKDILGEGGFGAAYLATDVVLQRDCVVKRMKIPKGMVAKQVQLLQSNFQREASLLAKLNQPGHPNIPEIYDYFSDESGNYLVMKFIEGKSLKGVIGKEGKIPWREAVRYVIDISDALQYMHKPRDTDDEPVMHRDIKPDNIMLGNDNRVWLLDFGLAKGDPVAGSGDINASMNAGTRGYAPLEQWRGKAGPVSDIYAVGATLHHLVTGINPSEAYSDSFNILEIKERHGVFTPIRQIDKTLPKDLEEIISKATAAEPDNRLTALQLKEQLEALISGGQEAALFTFKSGDSAKNIKEFVNLCEKYKKEAQDYLERGDFQRWFQLINRNDLVETAEKAVRQGKSPKERLDRFLKLLVPNLALIRLRRTTVRLVRAAIVVFLIVVITVSIIGAAGAVAAGSFIRQTVSSAGWNFNNLSLDEPNEFTKEQIDRNLESLIGAYVDNVEANMQPPDQVDVKIRWSGIDFRLPVAIGLEAGKPHLEFSGIGNVPIPFVLSQISQGFNNGINDTFQKSPVDFTELSVEQDRVVVLVAESNQSGRPALPTATPLPTNTPTVTPTAPPTATPEGLALVTIFNETGREIVLNLEGEIIEMGVDDGKAIEKQPGTYNYAVIYKDTGTVVAEGQKTWEVTAYKWRIRDSDE